MPRLFPLETLTAEQKVVYAGLVSRYPGGRLEAWESSPVFVQEADGRVMITNLVSGIARVISKAPETT